MTTLNAVSARGQFDHDLASIQKHLDWVRGDVTPFNNDLPGKAEEQQYRPAERDCWPTKGWSQRSDSRLAGTAPVLLKRSDSNCAAQASVAALRYISALQA